MTSKNRRWSILLFLCAVFMIKTTLGLEAVEAQLAGNDKTKSDNVRDSESLRIALDEAKKAESNSLETAMKLYEGILQKYKKDPLLTRALFEIGILKAKYIIYLKETQVAAMKLPPTIAADTQPTPLIDKYIAQYPQEFEKAGYSGLHVQYNGYHFRKIISDFPMSGLEDAAAYELTKLRLQFDCESASCYITFALPQVRDFLRQYPKSPLADNAVERVNAALAESVKAWADERSLQEDERAASAREEILRMAQDYEGLTAHMPEKLRAKATDAIAKTRKSLDQPVLLRKP